MVIESGDRLHYFLKDQTLLGVYPSDLPQVSAKRGVILSLGSQALNEYGIVRLAKSQSFPY